MSKPAVSTKAFGAVEMPNDKNGSNSSQKVPSFLQSHLKKFKRETNGVSMGAPQTRATNQKQAKACEKGCDHTDKWKSCVKDVSKKGSADNAYAVCTANLGPSQKESAQTKTVDLNFWGRLREVKESEAGSSSEGKRFRVTLLQEGLGNLKDGFYYTAQAIQSAVPIFEGKQFFVNHPGASEEQDRPERDVRDIAGYFENCAAGLNADGVTCLDGDLVMMTGPAFERERTLMMESLQYSLKHQDMDLVGLSINASGDFSTVGIEAFLNEQPCPDACKPKLLEALSKGITMIRPVQEIDSAVSCDLVTTAGAGGKINKLLEGGKNMPKQEEAKQEEKKEAGDAGADGAADADAGHDDADQDKDLILQMMKKYLGDGFSDEEKGMAQEAYNEAKSMCQAEGMDDKKAHAEAMDIAGKHMKMAKHMQKKEKSGDPSSDASAAAAHQAPGQGEPAKEAKQEEAGAKNPFGESDKKVVTLTAKNAALEAELTALKLEKHIEGKLRESRLPMAASKKFKEAIKGVKTVKDFDEKLNLFQEAFNAGGEADGSGFILSVEKGASAEAGKGFGDCIDK